MARISGYEVNVPQERLDAIRDAVATFDCDDYPDLIEVGDFWSAGTSLGFLRRLCGHWIFSFDWRAQMAAINRFPQMMYDCDDRCIHLLHERGSRPKDAALVLSHGWSRSFVEFLGVIERFAPPERFGGIAIDGIDVVVPALPASAFLGAQ